jgi:hypothetical protein
MIGLLPATRTLTSSQRRALDLTHQEWMVMYEAVVQYVENQADVEDDSEEDMFKANAARTIVERFDAVFCELAELADMGIAAQAEREGS